MLPSPPSKSPAIVHPVGNSEWIQTLVQISQQRLLNTRTESHPPPLTPEEACEAISTMRRKENGSSVAYMTIGTFLSQNSPFPLLKLAESQENDGQAGSRA